MRASSVGTPKRNGFVSDKLEQHGAIVSVYQSAQAAAADAVLVDLIAFAPTVFICDLSMAGLGRLRFMRRSRAFPPERGRIPAIAITDVYHDFASAPVSRSTSTISGGS